MPACNPRGGSKINFWAIDLGAMVSSSGVIFNWAGHYPMNAASVKHALFNK
jgi:hypothetical protein